MEGGGNLKKIYFENPQGKVEMLFGGTGPVRVTALSGLGNPKKRYTTVSFAGRDGQKTLSAVAEPRTIIIRGDIKITDKTEAENMLKVLHEPGYLILDFGDKKRKIYCSQVDFEDGQRNRRFMSFVLTLTADEVYFTDVEKTDQAVFERKDLLSGDIVFPCVFTEKTTEAIVENYGEVNVEPVITIYNLSDENDSDGEIVILNRTTDQKITLETGTDKNEVITVNVSARKITSSLRGNIVHLISDDTFLNKFWLTPGKNTLCASHNNEGERLSVVCSYYSNYREGIY